MVFTLAVAMLAGTPLTASAAGLADIYKTEDRWGNTVEENGPDDNVVGTVSSTMSNTNTNSEGLRFDAKIGSILIDGGDVNLILDDAKKGSTVLTAIAATKAGEKLDDTIQNQVKGMYTWKSSNTAVVALENPNKDKGETNVMKLVATGVGKAKVTVSLDDYKNGNSIFEDIETDVTFEVEVNQYASKLKFDSDKIKRDAYAGNKLFLDEYVIRYDANDNIIEDSEDELTYTLIDDGGKKATLQYESRYDYDDDEYYEDCAVLNLKQPTKSGSPVQIAVMGEKTKAIGTIVIEQGANATKLTYTSDKGTVKGSNFTVLANNDGTSATVTVEVSGKKGNKNIACTDTVSWYSANYDIVDIGEIRGVDRTGEKQSFWSGDSLKFDNDKCELVLNFNQTGKTQIIGTVSSGKTFKLNVTVNADLTRVHLDYYGSPSYAGNGSANNTLHTGQIINLNDDLNVNQYFDANGNNLWWSDGAIKWEFTNKKTMSKVAKLNAKTGVLEILSDAKKDGGPADGTITVRAINAKKPSVAANSFKDTDTRADGSKYNEISFKLQQVVINEITIQKSYDSEWKAHTESGKKQDLKPTDWMNYFGGWEEEGASYILNAPGFILDDNGNPTNPEPIDLAYTLGWTASGNGKIVQADKDGKYAWLTPKKKGSATITASGVTKNNKDKYVAVKTTFKTTVYAPSQTLSLSIKNTDIAAKYKGGKIADQKITIKPILAKGSTTKNKDNGKNIDVLGWSAYLIKPGTSESAGTKLDIPDGKLTLKNYEVGDQVKVRAWVKNSDWVADEITLTVVYPTSKVVFKQSDESGNVTTTDVPKAGVTVEKDGAIVYAYINSTKDGESGVADGINRAGVASCTVTGTGKTKGAAFVIVKEGKVSIQPVKAGDIKISFVMNDGKKATLKAKINGIPDYLSGVNAVTSLINEMFK